MRRSQLLSVLAPRNPITALMAVLFANGLRRQDTCRLHETAA